MKTNVFFLVALTSFATSLAAKTAPVKLDTLKTYTLEGVQVKSTRAGKKTPVAFKNLSQQQIKSVNFGQDLPYLLSLTPSVLTTSDAGNGIGYTSLRVRGTDPTRINITSNGIPVNDSESSAVYWVNMGDFASSVSSLQVQRGVGTSTNGSSAFGATVNMETEKIGLKPFSTIDLSAGSYASNKQTLRFGTGLLGGHWGVQGRLSHIGSDGYIDRASTKLNSYFIQAGYFANNTVVKFITYNGTERTYHAWDYASKYDQMKNGRTFNPSGKMEKDAQGNLQFYKDQTDNYHQQHYQLLWTQLLNKDWNLNMALHYTNGKGYYEQYKKGEDLFGYGLAPVVETSTSALVRQKHLANDFYGAIASLNYDSHNKLTATFGAGWNKYDGDHFGYVTWVKKPVVDFMPYHKYYDNNAVKTDFNIYGKLNYELVDGLNAFLDLQYRHVGLIMNGPTDTQAGDGKPIIYRVNDKFNYFNPKFGLNYELNKQNRLYISYAVSHREPVRNNYEHALNANLEMPRSERLNDLELGYQFKSNTFTAGANVYYMHYKNQFVLTGEVDALGEPITRNFAKSYRLGIELEAAYQPVDWFRWDFNTTLSRNRVSDVPVLLTNKSTTVLKGEKPLAFSPDVMFNNIFTFNYKGLKAMMINRFVGEQYMTNTGFKTMETKDENGNTTFDTIMLKSFFTTDIDLSYNFSCKKLGVKDATVGFTVYNLFSCKYDTNGWAAPQYVKEGDKVKTVNTWGKRDKDATGFAPAAPANFMAHLSFTF